MKTFYKILASCVLLFSLGISSCKYKSGFEINNEKVKEIIAAHSDSVKAAKTFPDKDVRKYLYKEFQEFYKDRDYSLAWLDFEEPFASSEELLQAIDESEKDGLKPENYNLSKIEGLLNDIYKIESKKEKRKQRRARRSLNKKKREEARELDTLRLHEIVKLDFLMTSSYLTYASHLLSGKINPNESELWFSKPRKKDLSKHLTEALSKKNVKASLEDLAPKHPQYAMLKKELERIRGVKILDSLPKIKFQKTLRINNSHPSVSLIKTKLKLLGDLDKNDSSQAFDKNTFLAVQRLQSRSGFEGTGVIDAKTIGILNWPIAERIKQIEVNMERMRWLPDSFGEDYILVNIPEYKMRLYEDGKKAVEMKVIVGTELNRTPIFSDSMEYIVFNPTWTVPTSIAVREFLPKVRENPTFFEDNNYTVYDSWKEDAEPVDCSSIDWAAVDTTKFNYRIVEAPGEKNSLGLIKFMFPNNLDIYLHDTPGSYLFNAQNRSFSHGCVRLEKPRELAAYLLKNKGWNLKKVNEQIRTNTEPETVTLPRKIPVHIVYWTAWVDDNKVLNFARDVYDHDKQQEKAIEKKEALL